MDPLALVREATMRKIPVNYTDNHYTFGKVKLHESTETAFKRTQTHRDGGYYTLRDVIFFLENAELGVAQYRVSVNQATGVTAVVVADAKDLKAYLTGQVATCDQIDQVKLRQSSSQPSSQRPSSPSSSAALAAGVLPEHLLAARQTVLESFLHLDNTEVDSSRAFLSRGSPQRQDPEMELKPSLSDDQRSFMTADRGLLTTLRADEFAASNRSSVLCKPGADFSFVLKLINDHVLRPPGSSKDRSGGEKKRSSNGGHDSAKRSRTSGKSHASSLQPPPGAAGTPIFIVPDALTATFSGFNATQFLRDGNFVSSEECRQRGLKRNPDGHRFSHTCKNGKVIEFKVVDNGKKLSLEEWNRVVVVFVQGQAWQFKGWQYSNPVDVFDKALGIHVCLDDGSEVAKNILSWKCEILKMHKTRRHMDASAFNQFWLLVEDYIRMHRPWLLR